VQQGGGCPTPSSFQRTSSPPPPAHGAATPGGAQATLHDCSRPIPFHLHTDTWSSCHSPPLAPQDLSPGQRLVELPPSCQLTYSAGSTPPALLAVIEQVPQELWGGRLGLQVGQAVVAAAAAAVVAAVAVVVAAAATVAAAIVNVMCLDHQQQHSSACLAAQMDAKHATIPGSPAAGSPAPFYNNFCCVVCGVPTRCWRSGCQGRSRPLRPTSPTCRAVSPASRCSSLRPPLQPWSTRL
jgi:hypothetical protein